MILSTLAAAAVTVVVTTEEPEGDFYVQLCSEAEFMADGGCSHQKISNAVARAEFVFEGVEPGRYAAMVWRDPDGDGEMPRNFIGIPREPVALSNDPRAWFGPPKFKDAAVDVPEGASTIRLQVD